MSIENFHTFKYNGKRLADLGAVIRQRPTIVYSLPDFEFKETPYKSGDIIIDKKRYKNKSFKIPIKTIPAFCEYDLDGFAYRLSEWLLLEDHGYKIYKDTYNPSYFRYGSVTEISDVIAVKRNVFEADITINFAPYLYSDFGNKTLTYTTAENSLVINLENPEMWSADPIIKITGLGQYIITVNNQPSMNVSTTTGFILDKPKEDVYDLQGNSCNNNVVGLAIPYLEAGTNTITITRSVGTDSWNVEITPNWRRM